MALRLTLIFCLLSLACSQRANSPQQDGTAGSSEPKVDRSFAELAVDVKELFDEEAPDDLRQDHPLSSVSVDELEDVLADEDIHEEVSKKFSQPAKDGDAVKTAAGYVVTGSGILAVTMGVVSLLAYRRVQTTRTNLVVAKDLMMQYFENPRLGENGDAILNNRPMDARGVEGSYRFSVSHQLDAKTGLTDYTFELRKSILDTEPVFKKTISVDKSKLAGGSTDEVRAIVDKRFQPIENETKSGIAAYKKLAAGGSITAVVSGIATGLAGFFWMKRATDSHHEREEAGLDLAADPSFEARLAVLERRWHALHARSST